MTDIADRIAVLIATHRATALRARAAEDVAVELGREAQAYRLLAQEALAQLAAATPRVAALERELRRLRADLTRLTAAATTVPRAAA